MDKKRYLLFAHMAFYPCGGWGDFVGVFSEQQEAILRGEKEIDPDVPLSSDYYEVVDILTLEIVAASEKPSQPYKWPELMDINK